MKKFPDFSTKFDYICIYQYKMKFTNINITGDDKVFQYIVEYIRTDHFSNHYYSENKFQGKLIRTENVWELNNKEYIDALYEKDAIIRLYFPTHSLDVYSSTNYALDIYTYIGSYKVELGSFLINRKNALACDRIHKFQQHEYVECIDIPIIDPYQLIYSDNCSDYRKMLKMNDLNTDGSILSFSLHPVSLEDTIYIKKDGYDGGQGGLEISESISDFLGTHLSYSQGEFHIDLHYNEIYKDLGEYLLETYKCTNYEIKYMLSVKGAITTPPIESYSPNIHIKETDIYEEYFSGWDKWVNGLEVISSTIISIGEEMEIILKSSLPITQELFSKIILSDTNTFKIDLDDDMTIVNQIQQNNIQYDIPNNSKSNIIIPVFYKVNDLGNIVIHPEVTENICINLDAYKSKVNSFILQIEGIKFKSIGTVTAGTIFKVIGSMLPRTSASGTFYVLSQDGDLVTTGKYIYEV